EVETKRSGLPNARFHTWPWSPQTRDPLDFPWPHPMKEAAASSPRRVAGPPSRSERQQGISRRVTRTNRNDRNDAKTLDNRVKGTLGTELAGPFLISIFAPAPSSSPAHPPGFCLKPTSGNG
ncbi:hypothetical protein CORC01_00321, partial [Colletotrichum orchidophilum]